MAMTLTSMLVRKSLRRSGLLLSDTEPRYVVGMCIEICLLSSRPVFSGQVRVMC